jgi:hypothetical protein
MHPRTNGSTSERLQPVDYTSKRHDVRGAHTGTESAICCEEEVMDHLSSLAPDPNDHRCANSRLEPPPQFPSPRYLRPIVEYGIDLNGIGCDFGHHASTQATVRYIYDSCPPAVMSDYRQPRVGPAVGRLASMLERQWSFPSLNINFDLDYV